MKFRNPFNSRRRPCSTRDIFGSDLSLGRSRRPGKGKRPDFARPLERKDPIDWASPETRGKIPEGRTDIPRSRATFKGAPDGYAKPGPRGPGKKDLGQNRHARPRRSLQDPLARPTPKDDQEHDSPENS